MTLPEIARIAEILSLLTIVFGLFFGIAQIRLSRIQRRDLATLGCAH